MLAALIVVPKAGLEPARYRYRGILSPMRLPFRHFGNASIISLAACFRKYVWFCLYLFRHPLAAFKAQVEERKPNEHFTQAQNPGDRQ